MIESVIYAKYAGYPDRNVDLFGILADDLAAKGKDTELGDTNEGIKGEVNGNQGYQE